MCLSEIDLNLKYDESEKDFIGYGYKVITRKITNDSGNIDWDIAKQYMYSKEWVEATGDYFNQNPNPRLLIDSDGYSCYFPGFHIFISKMDAEIYGLNKYKNPILVKVAFKNVTSFGQNITYGFDTGPCVVARYMKIVEILEG